MQCVSPTKCWFKLDLVKLFWSCRMQILYGSKQWLRNESIKVMRRWESYTMQHQTKAVLWGDIKPKDCLKQSQVVACAIINEVEEVMQNDAVGNTTSWSDLLKGHVSTINSLWWKGFESNDFEGQWFVHSCTWQTAQWNASCEHTEMRRVRADEQKWCF